MKASYVAVETQKSIFQESDDEEHFIDISDPTESPDAPLSSRDDVTKERKDVTHVTSSQGHVFVSDSRTRGYQANTRNPLYSGAENSCSWELMKLSEHYHPSVRRFAQHLLQVLKAKNFACEYLDIIIGFYGKFCEFNLKQL